MPKGTLLKRWNDWSAGVGYLRDDGRNPGMYTALAIIGRAEELRPAPEVGTTLQNDVAGISAQYFFEVTKGDETYLYVQSNPLTAGDNARQFKLDLRNATFGDLISGSTTTSFLGQPAPYQGNWYWVQGANVLELTTVGTPPTADTVNSAALAFGALDHLTPRNFQLALHSSLGVSILKLDGNPLTAADWGSSFQVGDKDERAVGLSNLGGATFVLKRDGLYSFGLGARSGLVFEDFGKFRNIFINLPMTSWKGGLVIPHPTGLLFFRAGFLPVNIGIGTRMGGTPPPGPPELARGKYHGVASVGDYLYTIYQPDVTSTSVLVMVGTPRAPNDPLDLNWQIVASTTLSNAKLMGGIGISTQGYPVSATVPTPSLWFANGDDFSRMIVGHDAGPSRSQADTHVVATSGDVYLSELWFGVPVALTSLVVYTYNMASGDEWQLSGIANGGSDINFGAPIKSNGRHVRTIDRHDVHRLMLHVNWATTSNVARVPPVIQSIELYGKPSVGEVE